MKKIKLFLFALLSLSTLVGFSQIDTIIVTPNSPSALLLTYPDSLGFNAKVSLRQPAPGNPIYECGYPNVTLESDITPIAIAIVYSDDNATQWLSTQFLFNLPYNDSLHFCLEYVGDCYCAISPTYDIDGDGIVCDTMWNSTPDSIPNDIVASWIYKLQCFDGVTELTNNVKVWPNPISGIVNINTPSNSGVLRIMSIDGRCAHQEKYFTNNIQFDSELLSSGTYVITLTDDSGKFYTTRIIK